MEREGQLHARCVRRQSRYDRQSCLSHALTGHVFSVIVGQARLPTPQTDFSDVHTFSLLAYHGSFDVSVLANVS